MKTIKVEVTEAQYRYIRALNTQMGPQSEGDFLLALAFAGVDYLHSGEGCIETIVASLNQFVRHRHLPSVKEEDFFQFGVNSRPANPPRQRTEAAPRVEILAPANRN